MKKTILLFISVLFINTEQKIFSQSYKSTYTLTISQDDVVVEKTLYGYEIYIRKKGDIEAVNLLTYSQSGKLSYISENVSQKILMIKTVRHPILGESFYIFLPKEIYLDNTSIFKLKDNSKIVAEAYTNVNGKIFSQNNEVILKTPKEQIVTPTLVIEDVLQSENLYAFYLSYYGGDNGKYSFYVREGRESKEYTKLPTMWGYETDDKMAVVINDTYLNGIGKELLIKAYFESYGEDRFLAFNVFDENGVAKTIPVEYMIAGTNRLNIKEDYPLPYSGESEKASVRMPPQRAVTQNTQTAPVAPQRPNITTPPKIINTNAGPTVKREKPIPRYVEGYTYDRDTLFNFIDIEDTLGEKDFVGNPKNIPEKIKQYALQYDSDTLDVCIVLDTTWSMNESIEEVKKNIEDISITIFNNYKSSRIGFVLFRDIGDAYLTKKYDFMDNINILKQEVKYFSVSGGGDKPEAMYDGINDALNMFKTSSKSKSKLIVVVTDAPAKETETATQKSVEALAKTLNVDIKLFIVPVENIRGFMQ